MRWTGDDDPPGMGDYLVSTGPRSTAAYQVHAVADRGKRGGLGEPTYRLVILSVERCPRGEAITGRHHDFTWDRPTKRRSHRLSEFA